MEKGTGIEIYVADNAGIPATDASVYLVGNYNSPEKQEVSYQTNIKTNNEGKTSVYFPPYSVITLFWHVAAEKDELKTSYNTIHISPGKANKIEIKLSGNRQ